MSLWETLFGGTDSSAQDHQLAQNRESKQLISRNADRARQDVLRMFPQAQQTLAQGTQAALDVQGQAFPQQMSAFQQGNMGAQDAQLRGLSAMQKALMGQPVDMSYARTQNLMSPINVDTSFSQQQVPQFIYGGAQGGGMQGRGQQQGQQAQGQQPSLEELIRQLLSGGLGGRF